MKAYAHSKTPMAQRDKRQTPWFVFNRILELINMPILLDVCAQPHTAKVSRYFTSGALTRSWRVKGGASWMNPPFSNPFPWCQKAYEESKKGAIIVGCLPDDRSTIWYQEWIEDKAAIVYVPDKRISFEDGRGRPQKGNPKGSVFPVWLPMAIDKTSYVRFCLQSPSHSV